MGNEEYGTFISKQNIQKYHIMIINKAILFYITYYQDIFCFGKYAYHSNIILN
jgi:hypothetical protein